MVLFIADSITIKRKIDMPCFPALPLVLCGILSCFLYVLCLPCFLVNDLVNFSLMELLFL